MCLTSFLPSKSFFRPSTRSPLPEYIHIYPSLKLRWPPLGGGSFLSPTLPVPARKSSARHITSLGYLQLREVGHSSHFTVIQNNPRAGICSLEGHSKKSTTLLICQACQPRRAKTSSILSYSVKSARDGRKAQITEKMLSGVVRHNTAGFQF